MSRRQGKNRFAGMVESGEDWLASYADLMSLLLGFFIILYSFSKIDDETLKGITEGIAESFKGEEGKKSESQSNVGLDAELRQLRALEMLVSLTEIAPDVSKAVEKIETMSQVKKSADGAQKDLNGLNSIREDLLTIAGRDREAMLEMILPSKTLFKSGTTVLTNESKRELRSVADAIYRIEDFVRVEITGHTDSRPADLRDSGFTNHWALSASRAGSVAESLIGYGIDPNTLKVQGKSFFEPLFEEYTPFGEHIPANMQRNRRVHIKVFRKDVYSPLIETRKEVLEQKKKLEEAEKKKKKGENKSAKKQSTNKMKNTKKSPPSKKSINAKERRK